MCNIAKVSKSGYYKWLKNKNKISFRNILDNTYIKEIFLRNKGKKGILRIKMELEEKYGINMNKKKIGRIMKEQGLITQTRRKNPYRQRTKNNEEKFYCENLLDRNFKDRLPYEAFGVDITYLKYNGKFGYLCTLIDVKTTEIVSYGLSTTLQEEFVLKTVEIALKDMDEKTRYNLIIHSDRGSQFTSKSYKKLLDNYGVRQSMSQAGSPRDNAVIESFFGHMKDEINLKVIKTFEQLTQVIDEYIYYFNNHRKQWSKNKMTPIEYKKFLRAC